MGRADAPFLSCGGAITRVGVVRNLTPNEYYAVRDAHAPHADALPRELDTRPKSPPSLSPTGVRACLATLSPRPPKNRDPVFIQSHKKRHAKWQDLFFFSFFDRAKRATRRGKAKSAVPGARRHASSDQGVVGGEQPAASFRRASRVAARARRSPGDVGIRAECAPGRR